MNVLLRVQPPPDTAKIAHSVIAYDRATEELHLELPIPLFLDTLALKIARVPPEDKYGALSYPLEARAVDTFRFLLGLDVDMSKREYFLESTVPVLAMPGLRNRASPSGSWSCRRCACLMTATGGGWPRAT